MAYVALYRKWRPQGFDSLVGQEAVRTALTNALETGRIAHAYLFAGPRVLQNQYGKNSCQGC